MFLFFLKDSSSEDDDDSDYEKLNGLLSNLDYSLDEAESETKKVILMN